MKPDINDRVDDGVWEFYDRFRMEQLHLSDEGLYRAEIPNAYFVVSAGVDAHSLAADGGKLRKWIETHKPMFVSIDVVSEAKLGWARVSERPVQELATTAGSWKSIPRLLVDLSIVLPRTFPSFSMRGRGGYVEFVFNRALSAEEESLLRSEYAELASASPGPPRIVIDPRFVPEQDPFRAPKMQGDIDLIPSTRLAADTPRALKSLWEEDEDIWRESRVSTFTGQLAASEDVLPAKWKRSGSRCFVHASVFEPNNIRNYLSIYDQVILVFPIAEYTESILKALRVTPVEMAELVGMGRLRIVLPQSIDRYDYQALGPIVEADRDAVILSRRLALATVLESRRRMPLLYPPVDRATRARVLRSLDAFFIQARMHRAFHLAFVRELATSWSIAEEQLQYQGALSTKSLGMGPIIAAAIKEETGRDLSLEFANAASTVEWGAALDSHVFPVNVAGYSEQGVTETVAAFYSGFRYAMPAPVDVDVHSVIDDVLAIDSDVPVVEFARAFGGGDIERFRKFVSTIAKENPDLETRNEIVRRFNDAVMQVDRREGRLSKLEIGGLLPALLVAADVKWPHLALMAIALKVLINYRSTESAGSARSWGVVLDRLNADLLVSNGPEAVMVARMKRQLGRM